MNDVKQKSFKRVYLITGDDPWLRHGFLSRLLKASAGEDTLNRMDVSGSDLSLTELRAFTDTMPFFAERRVLVIEDSGLFRVKKKAGEEESPDEDGTDRADSAEKDDEELRADSGGYPLWLRNLPETALVIFTESKADGRSALYKLIAKIGSVTVAERPKKAEELRRFAMGLVARSGLKITPGAFDRIIERLPLDYGMAETEIEKLISHCLEKGAIREEDVEQMILPRLEDRVFDLVERVSSGDRRTTLRYYYDLVALRTSPLLILTLIGKEFVRLLNVGDMSRKGLPDREIMMAMSLPKDWLVDKYRRTALRFSRNALVRAADLASELEKDVKSGNLGENAAVEILILELTGRVQKPK